MSRSRDTAVSRCCCLILGPEGAGKTLLLKKLCRLSQEGWGSSQAIPPPSDDPSNSGTVTSIATDSPLDRGVLPTIPTVGTNVQEITMGDQTSCILKEYGGSMAPLWSKAYPSSHMVVYVIDSSNSTQISATTILLLEVLSACELRGKPFLLFFNKLDSPFRMSLLEFKSIVRVDDVVAHANQRITVVEGSCVTEEGLREVVDWITENAKLPS